jgi:hypothetical protein
MNLTLFFPLVVTSLVTVIGWFALNYFANKSDRINRQKDLRINFLIQAYRDIGMASSRDIQSEHYKKLELAFHDIQLFGTTSQIEKLHNALSGWHSKPAVSVEVLLSDLRDDLRKEMNLPKDSSTIIMFRTKK